MKFFGEKQKGLSLIEVIVYVAILAVLLALVVNTLLIVGRSYQELRAHRLVNSSARSALERMTRDARDALSVDQISSTLGAHPGNLILNTLDESEAQTTVEFYVENDVLKIREGGVYSGDLTLEDVSVDNLVFSFIDASSSEAVRIEFTITATSGRRSVSENYYSTAVLRGSYDL